MLSFSYCLDSIFGLLDLAPIDALFEHDSGSLDGRKGLEHAQADPEEHDHEDDSEESVGVDPLADKGVGVEDGFGLGVCEHKSHYGHDRCG